MVRRGELLRWCSSTLLCGMGVASACVKMVPSPASIPDRSSYFAVIAESMLSDTTIVAVRRAIPLQFDPYPLRPDSDVTHVGPDTRASGAEAEVRGRKGVLDAMHLAVGNGEIPADCAGTEAPDTPDEPRHRGCPTVRRYVVAVAQPRQGDGTVQIPTNEPGRYWTSRVILTSISPDGYNSETRDYVLDSTNAGWSIVKKKRLHILE